MIIESLSSLLPNAPIDADLVIVGAGPAGLTLARELAGTGKKIIVLESGDRQARPEDADLNRLESVGQPRGEAQLAKRLAFHGENVAGFSNEVQPYGVRCRGLGGASQAWAGKSALFDETDFTKRDWAPNSGWPIRRDELAPYFDRAAAHLNLGPNIYDAALWKELGLTPHSPQLNDGPLRSFFWQFARSRVDAMDVMRFGSEIGNLSAPNIQVLLNATATSIVTNEAGDHFEGLEVAAPDGRRWLVRAKAGVLAAGGIETPRLMLASQKAAKSGVGNQHDVVGRYLMDHPGARLGWFESKAIPVIARQFGFLGMKRNGVAHMYMHGLTPSPEVQRRDGLLNCAVYMMGIRAPDDPWDALKRLLRRRSDKPLSDVWALVASPGLMAKGIGLKAFESRAMPKAIKDGIVNLMIRTNPNFVAAEYESRGLPHKLTGFAVDAISEQIPDPDSRITLSPDRRDKFGVPIARADWRIHEAELRTLTRLGRLLTEELPRAGLPAPVLEDWVINERLGEAVVIDMAHTIGTTRMSDDPRTGVVDANCKVHGVDGLYVAGSSVFPTSGHANPTLMLLSLTVRLADHLKVGRLG